MFSVGLSPPLVAAVRASLAILKAEPWRVERLRQRSMLLLELVKQHDIDTGPAIGAGIVPVLFRTREQCMQVAMALLSDGYYAPPILQSAVPKDEPRIRFFFSADHSQAQITGVVASLAGLLERIRHRRIGAWPMASQLSLSP